MTHGIARDRRPSGGAGLLAAFGAARRDRRRVRRRLRPTFLPLEDRRLLSAYTVDSTADDGSTGTLRWAVAQADAATTPSTIQFFGLIASTTITLAQGPLVLGNTAEPVTFDLLLDQAPVTIVGNDGARIFQVDSGVQATMTGMTITGGSTTGNGGGLYNAGELSVSMCTVSGNTAGAGGGLYNTGKLYIQNSTISGNSAVGSAPGLFNLGLADLTDCTLSGNTTDAPPITSPSGGFTSWIYGQTNSGTGGAVFNHGTANLTDCTLGGNTALVGSGVFNYGQCDMIACTVTGNANTAVNTPRDFNGILFDYEGATTTGYLTFTDALITGNDSHDNPFCTTASADTIAGTNDAYDGPIGVLGDYGGPTATVPLLPGNPAIGAGIRIPGVTTDQRGVSLPTIPDIGAFQDQGYVITIDANSTPQSAVTGDQFANPLTVTVTANVAIEPVVGGTVAFTAPSSGPSASLSTTATIGSNDEAQDTATANETPGSYTVIASDGGASTVDFALTNLYPSSFTGLGDQTFSITYGTPTLTIDGTLSGDSAVPTGEQVAVTLDNTTVKAVIQSDGSFSATLDTASLPASTSAYPIDLSYGGDASFAPAAATDTLTVTQATPTIQVIDNGAPYNDNAFTATVQIAGVGGSYGPSLEGFIPSVAYYPGAFTSVSQINVGPLSGAPVDAGTYTAVATFPGSTDYITDSALTYFIIAPATPEVIVNDASGTFSGQPFIAAAAVEAIDGSVGPSLEGVTPTLTYYSGTYSTVADLGAVSPLSGPPTAPGSYTVLAHFAGSADYAANSNLANFTIAPAMPTVTVSDPDGTYNGAPFNATDSITGLSGGTSGPSLQGVSLALTYYSGTYVNLAQLVGVNALSGAPSDPGMYTVVASFAGSTDYAADSNIANFTIAAAKPTVTVTDPSGPYTGNAFIAGGSVAGLGGGASTSLEGVGLSLTYYSGTYPTAPQLAGVNALPGAPIAIGSYTVLASFPGSTDYGSGSALANFGITQGVPQITWVPQGTLTFGTPIGSAQLDATANVPGAFTYSPAPGARLPAGGQMLSVSFQPEDTTDYRASSDSVTIDVARAMPALSVSAPGGTFDGSPFPASVAIGGGGYAPAASLEDTATTLTYYAGTGTSGAGLGSTPPTAPGTYTVVASFPGSTDYAPSQSTPATFTIAPAGAALSLTSSGASSVYVQPVTFVATVNAGNSAAGRPGGSVTFLLDGVTPIATVALDGSGQATLTTSSLAVGSHSITATYSGNADFLGGASGSASETVGPAATQVVLVPHPVLKKKKVKAVGLTAEIESMAPGGGLPTGGLVTFEFAKKHGKKVKTKTLGTAAVAAGAATLTLKPNQVLKKPLTLLFSGDLDYTASTASPPALTQKALKRLPPTPPA